VTQFIQKFPNCYTKEVNYIASKGLPVNSIPNRLKKFQPSHHCDINSFVGYTFFQFAIQKEAYQV